MYKLQKGKKGKRKREKMVLEEAGRRVAKAG
jgi:hypothetical protein